MNISLAMWRSSLFALLASAPGCFDGTKADGAGPGGGAFDHDGQGPGEGQHDGDGSHGDGDDTVDQSDDTHDGALSSSPLGIDAQPFAPATMNLRLTDAPGDFEQVPVTIASVSVHITPTSWPMDDGSTDTGAPPPTDGGDTGTPETETGDTGAPETDEGSDAGTWLTVVADPFTVDLLTLQDGVSAALGAAELPPGTYDQLRLIVSEAAVVVDGETHTLTIPSGAQTGIKLNLDQELGAGEDYELMLDFDAHESVRQTGNGSYKLQPVITVDYFGPPREHAEDGGTDDSGSDDSGSDDSGTETSDTGSASE